MNKQVNHIWRGFLLMTVVLFFMWLIQLLAPIKPVVKSPVANNTSALPVLKIIRNKKGEQLFKENCDACHSMDKLSCPNLLLGVTERVQDRELLYAWIRDSQGVLKTGDNYFTNRFEQFNKTVMPAFPNLTNEDISNIVDYIEEW